MRLLRALLPLVVLVLAAHLVSAADLKPVPDFTDHAIPQTQFPSARADWQEWLDVGALATGLILATWFALVWRSRRGLFVLSVISLVWLGFWRKGCICPIGSVQNIALGLVDSTYVVPGSVVVLFALPLVFALLFGRTFCAAVCPLGAVQEMVAIRPKRVPVWLDQALGIVAYVYLGAAVLFAVTGAGFIICRYDPFVGLFRMNAGAGMLALSAGFLIVGMFIGRPYCRYLCPYGALLGLASRLSRWHVRIPPKDCIQCKLCEDACPYDAIREPTVPLSVAQRRRGRHRLAALTALVPLLVVAGALLGHALAFPMALMHPVVELAERMRLEESGDVEGTTDATDNFRTTGRPADELYREAEGLIRRTGTAAAWFGAWVGLVVGGKLIHLSLRRGRVDYEPDRTACVSCGRCFWYCPSEQERQGWVEKIGGGVQRGAAPLECGAGTMPAWSSPLFAKPQKAAV